MAALLYAASAAVMLFLVRRHVLPLTWRAGLVLALLPLVVTGYALVTGGVYGPIDLAYESEPLASVAADQGIDGVVNPLLTDVHRLMIPWKKAVRYSFAHGQWPLWNPFNYGGDILAAASEPSPWHPFHLLSYLLPLAQSVTFHATLVLFAAALCTFLFARELGASEIPAVIAAAAWMLSTFFLFFAQVPLGSTILLQPLLFLAVRRIVRDARYGNFILLVIALTLAVVAGHPESSLHVVSLGVVYGVMETVAVLVANRRRAGGGHTEPWRGVGAAIAAGIVALLLSAIHLLPFVEALPQTADYQHRATKMRAEDRAVTWRAASKRLVADFIPYAIGSPASEDAHVPPVWREPVYGYAGSILFPPALLALLAWRDRAKWFLLALMIVGFLAGVSAPGVTHALAKLPLFDIALNQRLVYAAVLAVCLLAAMGIELWIRDGRQQLLTLATLALLVVIGISTWNAWPWMEALGLSAPWLRAHAARELIPLVLMLALLVQRPSARFGAAAMLALLLIQQIPADSALTPSYPAAAFYPRTPLLDALPKSESPYRVVGVSSSLVPNTSLHYELEDPRGFHGMTFSRLLPTLELWSRPQPVSFNAVDRLDARFLDFLNVRYAIGRAGDPVPAGWTLKSVYRGGHLLENTHALERAFVPRHIVTNEADANVFRSLAMTDDLSERAWIAGDGGPQTDVANGPGVVRVKRDGTALRIDATMTAPGWVVISETAWKGWKASIDGRGVPVRMANYAFLAVHVPAGKHDLRLWYLPSSFAIGGFTSLATLIALIAIPLVRRRIAR
jgi:hypothetical protein